MKVYLFLYQIYIVYKFYKMYEFKNILSKTFSGIIDYKFRNYKEWGDMYFELICDLMWGLWFLMFTLCVIEWSLLNEINVKFLKYYDILSMFKWIIWKLEIAEN